MSNTYHNLYYYSTFFTFFVNNVLGLFIRARYVIMLAN